MKDKIKSILYLFILVQLLMAVPTSIKWKEIIPFQYDVNWFIKFLTKDLRIVIMSFFYLWIAFVYLEKRLVFVLFLIYNIYQIFALCVDYKLIDSFDSLNELVAVATGLIIFYFIYKESWLLHKNYLTLPITFIHFTIYKEQ